jgi:hypothetical protein
VLLLKTLSSFERLFIKKWVCDMEFVKVVCFSLITTTFFIACQHLLSGEESNTCLPKVDWK